MLESARRELSHGSDDDGCVTAEEKECEQSGVAAAVKKSEENRSGLAEKVRSSKEGWSEVATPLRRSEEE